MRVWQDGFCKFPRGQNRRGKFTEPGGDGGCKLAVSESDIHGIGDFRFFQYILCTTGECDGFILG